MFIDKAKVFIKAGKGGDGVVSFRHEIYVDKGGPDGGDGGKGGDVIFKAIENLNTLLDFRYKPELKAENGLNGAGQKRRGRSGEDLIIKVPIGTVVSRDGDVLADLIENDQEVVIAKGGDGGFGNAHFKSSVRQTPKIAEVGEKGEVFEAELELKLLADVGLVGFPNAGKSTFLSVVSNAKPEIADYEFTTLVPNLGVADIDDTSILISDIPGLIEGASSGRGLGDKFLRHVERTAVLLHMIDVYSNNPVEDYRVIRQELSSYSDKLAKRPEIIALTKCDGLDDDIIQMQKQELQKITKSTVFTVSSFNKTGLKELLRELSKQVVIFRHQEQQLAESQEENTGLLKITLSNDKKAESWHIKKVNENKFLITGHKIEKFARRTNFEGTWEDLARLRNIMWKMGITRELVRQGATGASIITIGRFGEEFTLEEQSK